MCIYIQYMYIYIGYPHLCPPRSPSVNKTHPASRTNGAHSGGALGPCAGVNSPATQEVGPGGGEEQKHATCTGWPEPMGK